MYVNFEALKTVRVLSVWIQPFHFSSFCASVFLCYCAFGGIGPWKHRYSGWLPLLFSTYMPTFREWKI